jgi:hypothetical protein
MQHVSIQAEKSQTRGDKETFRPNKRLTFTNHKCISQKQETMMMCLVIVTLSFIHNKNHIFLISIFLDSRSSIPSETSQPPNKQCFKKPEPNKHRI